MDNGANPGIKDKDGCTMLMGAALGGELHMYRRSRDGILTRESLGGGNPVSEHIRASEANRLEILKIFIEKGADVDDRNNAGWTALKYALWGKRPDVMKLLKEAGARE